MGEWSAGRQIDTVGRGKLLVSMEGFNVAYLLTPVERDSCFFVASVFAVQSKLVFDGLKEGWRGVKGRGESCLVLSWCATLHLGLCWLGLLELGISIPISNSQS